MYFKRIMFLSDLLEGQFESRTAREGQENGGGTWRKTKYGSEEYLLIHS
jgi:hypothetical protein